MTHGLPAAAPSAAELDAARLLLARMGISPADLLRPAPDRAAGADVRRVRPGRVGGGQRRDAAGVRLVLEPDRRALGHPAAGRAHARRRSSSSPSTSRRQRGRPPQRPRRAQRGRAPDRRAALPVPATPSHDGLIAEADNPARKVAKPRRLPTTRRAVPDTRLAEINHVAATTGNDPALDTLLLRLHTETACRRGGALALRPVDLDPDQCLILLREKGETVRWQPVSPTLMAHLPTARRGAARPADGQLLRYRRRAADHLPPLRPPVGAHRPAPAVGGDPADQHPLAAAHHADLGRAELRLRRRPRLRRPHRQRQRRRRPPPPTSAPSFPKSPPRWPRSPANPTPWPTRATIKVDSRPAPPTVFSQTAAAAPATPVLALAIHE